jgi:hypothetical protein
MTYLAALSKVACSTAVVLLLGTACGGNSFSGGQDPKGGSDSGGSNAGGSVTDAGKHQGGSASGGSSTAGTASGGASTAGAGGSPGGEACNAPPASGNCDAYFEAWYHDPSTGLCRPFIYGGCGGNENNHDSFEACQKACPGGSPNYDACLAPTDCVIAGEGCCGVCDAPDVSPRQLLAYNRKYAGLLQQCAFNAAEGAAPPGDIACAPCPIPVGDTGSLKYFVPNCVQGQCVVEDVRTSAVSKCEANTDCYVRNGNSCCESCTKQSIALNKDGGFEDLVCAGELPCPACAIAPISDIAVCGASGHCEVRVVLSPEGR